MRLIYSLLSTLLSLYETVRFLVRRLVGPVLEPARRVLLRSLPARWQIIDWSVLALWLLIGLARRVLMMLFGAMLFW